MKLPRPSFHSGAVPEAKAWSALLMTCAQVSLAAAIYIDPGPTRVLAPVLVAAVATVSLWRPARFAGLASAVLAATTYVLTGVAIGRAEGNSLIPIASAAAVLALGLLGTGALANALAVWTERSDLQRRLDARIIEELTPTLGGTRVLKWQHAVGMLRDEIDRARRYGHVVSLAMIRAGDMQPDAEDASGGAGDQAWRLAATIGGLLRTTDKVAVSGAGELAILMPHTSLEAALAPMHRLESAVRKFGPLDFRVGIAEFPNDAADADELVEEARHALDFAGQMDVKVASRSLLQGG